MSDVEFDTDIQGNPKYGSRSDWPDRQLPSAKPNPSDQSAWPGWLIRHGIINSESGAKSLLIGIVVFNFIAMGLIIYFFVL